MRKWLHIGALAVLFGIGAYIGRDAPIERPERAPPTRSTYNHTTLVDVLQKHGELEFLNDVTDDKPLLLYIGMTHQDLKTGEHTVKGVQSQLRVYNLLTDIKDHLGSLCMEGKPVGKVTVHPGLRNVYDSMRRPDGKLLDLGAVLSMTDTGAEGAFMIEQGFDNVYGFFTPQLMKSSDQALQNIANYRTTAGVFEEARRRGRPIRLQREHLDRYEEKATAWYRQVQDLTHASVHISTQLSGNVAVTIGRAHLADLHVLHENGELAHAKETHTLVLVRMYGESDAGERSYRELQRKQQYMVDQLETARTAFERSDATFLDLVPN